MPAFPRGSMWRRWDLHVHTPSSIVQGYGGDTAEAWDRFIRALRALPSEISVIAVTDYLFIDGYEKLIARRDEIPNIALIIPNIEFRLNTFSGTANNNKRHNFHVLFDPTVTPAVIREQLLNCMSTGYRIDDNTEWRRTPTANALVELGAAMKRTAPEGTAIRNKTDLMAGFDNITHRREDILENLTKDCFKGKYLLGIGYSEWDQSRWDQAAAEKRTLINESHFALTSNDDVEKVAEHVADLEVNQLNSLVLHSSDSHDFERLGKTKLWLKADPTFAGLKQVINEPERVFIGDAPPRFKQLHQVIDSIAIPASNGWFANPFKLELNEGLVAVIGGRGSGKSALTEMLAAAVGEADDHAESFVRKASEHVSSIHGTVVTVNWADGSSSEGTVLELGERGLIRYLPQKAVERLCAPQNNDALVAQIETVIFQSLPETDRLGASDFTELKSHLLMGFHFEREQVKSELSDLNRKYHDLDTLIRSLPSKTNDLENKKKEIQKLNADLPKLPEADSKAQDQLAQYLAHKKLFEDAIVQRRKGQEQLTALSSKVKVFASTVASSAADLFANASAAGVGDLDAFRPVIDIDRMQVALATRNAELQGQIDVLRSGERAEVVTIVVQIGGQWPYENYDSLVKVIEAKTGETKAFETVKIKYQQHKQKIAQLATTIEALEKEIASITNLTKPELEQVRKARIDKYCEFFALLTSEKNELAKLYQPLQSALDQGSETDRRLRFEAAFGYDVETHIQKGLEILDRTRRGNFRDQNALRDALNRVWTAFTRGGFAPDSIREALKTLFTEFIVLKGDDANSRIELESQLREGCTLDDFFEWFFSLDHFSVTSALRFDDTDLYLLSPGQKGIVLLMLYLAMDRDDTRPLVIDQPEDNLDNLSVYRDLIRLFRARKQFRQIILVTHNPNLVVNTDAEQIVIASYDGKATPRIVYRSGSLENQAELIPGAEIGAMTEGIIESVCDILEGGPNAFGGRSKVYKLSPRIS